MRILIVGATGTIGVPVVQALEVRHEVIPRQPLSLGSHRGFGGSGVDPAPLRRWITSNSELIALKTRTSFSAKNPPLWAS